MSKRAFTLIEIVMVLVILVMLVSIAIPKYLEQREQAKIDLTKQNFQNLRMALENYYMAYRVWPSNDLSDLVFKSQTWGPDRRFIEKIPIEAITGSSAVKNGVITGTGGWVWDYTNHKLHINLFDDPSDPRKKYSEW